MTFHIQLSLIDDVRKIYQSESSEIYVTMQVTHEHLFSISWIKHLTIIEPRHHSGLCLIEYLTLNYKSLRLKKITCNTIWAQ